MEAFDVRWTKIVAALGALALWAAVTHPAAAAPSVAWHQVPAFSVTGVATDGRGHVYVSGFAPRGEPEYFGVPFAMVLVKLAGDGTRSWTRWWRSEAERFPHAVALDVAVSADGRDVYVAGGVLLDSTEDGKATVWAYSSAGRLRWSRQTPAENWWMAASANDRGVVTTGGFTAAWSRAGERRWMRPFLDRTGDLCFLANDVEIGRAGDLIEVGYLDLDPTCNDVEGGALQDADVVIQRRAPDGDVAWRRVRDDPDERDVDRASAVSLGPAGVFVAGEDDGRAWLARLTMGGSISWERRWGDRGRAVDVSVAPWGIVYVLSEGGRAISLRSFTSADGDPLEAWRGVVAGERLTGSAVDAGRGRALYVAASRPRERGDIWRLRP